MDTYYCCMCLCVEVDLDLCLCVLVGKMWRHMVREQMYHVACFQSHRHFLVSKFTKPKLYESKHQNDHSIFIMGKGFSVSQRAFRCDDTRASLDVLGFPSSFAFAPSCSTFFPSEWRGWFHHSSGSLLSSDRSLFPGFVSVICGHYINSHGWTEEWEKGCNTHPDLANRWSQRSGGHFLSCRGWDEPTKDSFILFLDIVSFHPFNAGIH